MSVNFDGNQNPVNGEVELAIIVRQIGQRRNSQYEDLEEICLLVESAGAEVVGTVISRSKLPHPATFIARGKVEELRQFVAATKATVVVVDHNISPVQERNLQKAISCRVVDRTRLILDIFARRASSREGKLQVELAQLKHLSTRLVRGWTHLERQKGGIGLSGPGETQLETDRRLIGQRIKRLKKRLLKIETQRELRRKSRKKVPISTVALVGYTNAGKSTLFNRLCGADVLSENRLFSTLDTTMRRLELPGVGAVILSDTVGFIRELPHGLVSAFHATLEEVASASLLLHVVDASCENIEERMQDVESVLSEIDAAQVPRMKIYNKIDLIDLEPGRAWQSNGDLSRIRLSAKTGVGIDQLLAAIVRFFKSDHVHRSICLPPEAGRLRSAVYSKFDVVDERITKSGESILNLQLSQKDINWLNSTQDFDDRYWITEQCSFQS